MEDSNMKLPIGLTAAALLGRRLKPQAQA